MMKNLLIAFTLISTTTAFGNDFICRVGKSYIKHDPSNGQIEFRKAKTQLFQVTHDEHEDQKELEFIDEKGKKWGTVFVSTGTVKGDNVPESFYANATVLKLESKNIIGFQTLKLPKTALEGSANTIIFDDESDVMPNLSISCFAAAID